MFKNTTQKFVPSATNTPLDADQLRRLFCKVFLEQEDDTDTPMSPLIVQRLSKIPGLKAEHFDQCKQELLHSHPCYLPRFQLEWIEYLTRTVVDNRTGSYSPSIQSKVRIDPSRVIR